jgi:WD40 repeat protein
MEMSNDEKHLLCGTKKGFVIIYSVNNNNFQIIDKLFYHNEQITSISINDNLNMFATSSKDGCVMLHTLPTFKLIRTIKLSQSSLNKNQNEQNEENEFIFANNVFLSSLPIPCITVFISSEKLFKTFSINGVPLFENNESGNSILIRSSTIIRDFNFQEILIYGTNDGFIKARKFPDMSLVNTIEFLDGQPIETFALSQDHRFCYTYSGGENIAIISDEETKINVENKTN